MKITSTTAKPLQLPDLTGGSDHIDLPPGVAVPVANWADYAGNVIVQAWVKAGVLRVGKDRGQQKTVDVSGITFPLAAKLSGDDGVVVKALVGD